jgi:fructose-bisphosphate aldolase class II
MPLVNMKEMLQHAYQNGYAVGAFELLNLDFLKGILDAAERCNAPVIVSLTESHLDGSDFELLMPAVEMIARKTLVPVAIQLNHAENLQSAVNAINRGCNSIMLNASEATLADNIQATRALVQMAHGCGVPVEGKLGDLSEIEGGQAEQHPGELHLTPINEARKLVEDTEIDFFAVAIGSVRGPAKNEPKLDIERLQEINKALRIPLVIHRGSTLSDDQFQRLIANGAAKINYGKALADVANATIRQHVESVKGSIYPKLARSVRAAIGQTCERCMRLWGSAGRAAEVLAQCNPWLPVEHLIIYNVKGLDKDGVAKMMVEGRRILSKIPGVREVVSGTAVKVDAAYRYTWLVRFCHPAVIDSYRDHPDHVAFANQQFRPVAGERISIDYVWIEGTAH